MLLECKAFHPASLTGLIRTERNVCSTFEGHSFSTLSVRDHTVGVLYISKELKAVAADFALFHENPVALQKY